MRKQAKQYEVQRAIKNATHIGQVRRWLSSERYWNLNFAFEMLVGKDLPASKPTLKTK